MKTKTSLSKLCNIPQLWLWVIIVPKYRPLLFLYPLHHTKTFHGPWIHLLIFILLCGYNREVLRQLVIRIPLHHLIFLGDVLLVLLQFSSSFKIILNIKPSKVPPRHDMDQRTVILESTLSPSYRVDLRLKKCLQWGMKYKIQVPCIYLPILFQHYFHFEISAHRVNVVSLKDTVHKDALDTIPLISSLTIKLKCSYA